MTEHRPYTAGSPLNGREERGDLPLPIVKVGCIYSPAHGYPRFRWNGYVGVIDQYAGPAAYRDVNEFFKRDVDDNIGWQEEKTGGLGLIDCERVFGGRGDENAQFVSFDEEEHARKSGRGWLVDQWYERGYELAQQGRQVVFHNGCPDSAHLARDAIQTGNAQIIGDFLRRAFESYNHCIERGIVPGFDGATGEAADSVSHAMAMLFANARRGIQIESSASTEFPHWKGYRNRIRYDTFKQRHMHGDLSNETWLDMNHPGFLEWYPDCRVSFFNVPPFMKAGEKWATEATRKAVITRMQVEAKKIIKAGCRVLLQSEVIKACMDLLIGAASFYPEGVK